MTEPRASPMPGLYILNTDGGMAPGYGQRRSGDPPGQAAIGGLLRTPRLATLATISETIGPATHNEAEYRALIKGLEVALDHGVQRIRVYMDSALVVDQVNGCAAVRQAHLGKWHAAASSLRTEFKSIRVSWVPREWNAEADKLASDAFSDPGLLGSREAR